MTDSLLITLGLPISLFIIMVGMGLALTPRDFTIIARSPRPVIVGMALQMLLLPALAFALGFAFGGGLLAAALVLCASLPGGTTSNVLTYLARANLALSVALTVLASIASPLVMPVALEIGLQTFLGRDTPLTLPADQTLATVLLIVVLPVALGMLVRARAPEFAQRAEPWVARFSMLVLALIIVGIVASQWAQLPQWLSVGLLPTLLLNVLALGLGILVGRLAGLSLADQLTLAIESGIKNTTLGLTIALSVMQSAEIAVPVAVYGLLMYATALPLCLWGRRMARRAEHAAPQA